MNRLAILLLLLGGAAFAQPITGTAVDDAGDPLEGVRVRVSPMGAAGPTHNQDYVVTGPDGQFSVPRPGFSRQGYIGIGRVGFLNIAGGLDLSGPTALGTVQMSGLAPIDNEHYAWVPPFWPLEDRSNIGCNACHGDQHRDWARSEMADSAKNPRVLSYYLGTDVDGAPAGEGYRKDEPDKAGPCANCHAPAAAIDAPGQVRLDEVEGVEREGVFCDVCHKIRDVIVDNGPGVGGSIQLHRPSARDGLFAFGPFEDITGPMRTSYSELITTSRVCAGCHEWTNEHGVEVMGTYSEWSEVAGADPDALQCQDCHMKKKFGAEYRGEAEGETDYIVTGDHLRQMHGVQRPTSRIYPHTFHGGREYAEEAADLMIEARSDAATGDLVVALEVQNLNAGHALPTGMPFRHMILVVEARTEAGPLEQLDGPTVPDFGGVGDSELDLAGRPGKAYAKVLGDDEGNRNVPFWRATQVLEDTRIRGAESDFVELRFAFPGAASTAEISARLIYRRVWRAMNLEKRWDEDDVLMLEVSAEQALEAPEAEPEPVEVDAGAEPEPEPGPGLDEEGDEAASSDGCGCRASEGSPVSALWFLLLLGPLRRRGSRRPHQGR